MGRIADRVRGMRGQSLAAIVAEIERMEDGPSDEQPDEAAFNLFWFSWPNKVGKPAAKRAYRAALKRGALGDDIFEGVHRYIREKPVDRPWLNPATFLNQERWLDQPAIVSKGADHFDAFGDFADARAGHGGSQQGDRLHAAGMAGRYIEDR